ncbi:MAG: ribokinase [Pseudomonadota bacterium]
MTQPKITILGIFVADMAFRADRQPKTGETLIGRNFALGPGGKGSNQAVAAGRAGADVTFLTRLGQDPFAEMASKIWSDANVVGNIRSGPDSYTGAAYIFVDDQSGENAIIVCPGAAMEIAPEDITAWSDQITGADIFMTQLEQPVDSAVQALRLAKDAGVTTIFNPAPAATLPDEIWPHCDFVTPNETEASDLTGISVYSIDSARSAGDRLLQMGAGACLITLGESGVLVHRAGESEHLHAICHAPVVDTTGAGDAFNGAFATALGAGQPLIDAARFGCAAAGIAVTRPGTAQSMATLTEIENALAR